MGGHSKLHEVLQEYSEVLKKELGTMKEIRAETYIDPAARNIARHIQCLTHCIPK